MNPMPKMLEDLRDVGTDMSSASSAGSDDSL